MVIGVVQYEQRGTRPWDGAKYNNTFAIITDNDGLDKSFIVNSIASGMRDYGTSGSWFKKGVSHLTPFRLMLIY